MITKFKKYKLITEDPDYVIDVGEYYARDALAFFVDLNFFKTKVNKLHISNFGGTHGDIGLNRYNNEETKRSYPGRLWLNKKVISFWVYPNEKIFVLIIKEIEKHLDIQMFNNDWKVEVLIDPENGNIRRKNDHNDDEYYGNYNRHDLEEKLIPIEDYAGSANQPEEKRKLPHLMTPIEKWQAKQRGEMEITKGFGSDLIAWDSKRPLPYRQAIYQENKNN